MTGSSTRQGTHHAAHTLTTTGCPRRARTRACRPLRAPGSRSLACACSAASAGGAPSSLACSSWAEILLTFGWLGAFESGPARQPRRRGQLPARHPAHLPVVRGPRRQGGQQPAPARPRGLPDRWNQFDESHTRTRKRNLVRRGSGGRDRGDRRRGRVQHEHDRLPGSADRSLVRRADRHDDLPGDRQLRRRRGRRRVARCRRSPGSSSATESPMASNWRADGTLRDYLVRNNIVAISDIDTRALTRRAAIGGRDARHHRDWRRRSACAGRSGPRLTPMEGSDLVVGVTCEAPFDWQPSDEPVRRVHAHAGAPRRSPPEDRGVRLRHEVEHPAPLYRVWLRRAGLPGDDARRPICWRSIRTACSSATAPAIRRRSATRSRTRKDLVEVGGAGLRHLPRAPGAGAGARRRRPTS